MPRAAMTGFCLARIAAAAALTLGACSTSGRPAVSLDGLLAFTNPATCEEAERTRAFMAAMVTVDDAYTILPGRIDVPDALKRAFGDIERSRTDHYQLVSVAVSGTWHGMRVRKIIQWFPDGGDPGGFGIELAAGVEDARRRLLAAGFPVAGDETAVAGDEVYERHVSLTPADGAGAVFACDFG